MRLYIKYFFVLVPVMLLLQSCEIYSLYRSGKTKKLQSQTILKPQDTLVVINPFIQEKYIDDYKTSEDIRQTRFTNNIQGINYNQYDWFQHIPKSYSNVGPAPLSNYQIFFEKPLQKLLKYRVHYFITKIQNDNRADTVEQELAYMENTLRDKKITEMDVSDYLCRQLQFYKKRYFLITHILEYHFNQQKLSNWSSVGYAWFRTFVIDIKTKKVLLYTNRAMCLEHLRNTYEDDHGFEVLKLFVRKTKRVLIKKTDAALRKEYDSIQVHTLQTRELKEAATDSMYRKKSVYYYHGAPIDLLGIKKLVIQSHTDPAALKLITSIIKRKKLRTGVAITGAAIVFAGTVTAPAGHPAGFGFVLAGLPFGLLWPSKKEYIYFTDNVVAMYNHKIGEGYK